MEIRAQQEFKGLLVQRLQILLLGKKRFLLNKLREKNLYFVEVAIVKENFFFGWRFENPCDRLIIEQQVNAVHTLSE